MTGINIIWDKKPFHAQTKKGCFNKSSIKNGTMNMDVIICPAVTEIKIFKKDISFFLFNIFTAKAGIKPMKPDVMVKGNRYGPFGFEI